MATATTTQAKVTAAFGDMSTRNISITPYSATSTALGQIKNHIMTFNASNESVTALAAAYKSDNNAAFTKFSNAEIITTKREVIWAKNDTFALKALREEEIDDGDGRN